MRRPVLLLLVVALAGALWWVSKDSWSAGNQKEHVRTSSARPGPSAPDGDAAGSRTTSTRTASVSDPSPTISLENPDVAVDDRPEIPGDRWVTGQVVDPDFQPIAGALVYFRDPALSGIDLGLAGMVAGPMMDQYRPGEVEGNRGRVRGNSRSVVTDEDGRFRIRWPRMVEHWSKEIDKAFDRALEKNQNRPEDSNEGQVVETVETISTADGRIEVSTRHSVADAGEDDFEIDWSTRPLVDQAVSLRAVHDDYLPAHEKVQPDGEVTLILGRSGGVSFLVTDSEGTPLEKASVRVIPEGLDFSRMGLEAETSNEGRTRILLPPGSYRFHVGHEAFAASRVPVEVSETIESVTVALAPGRFIHGRVIDAEQIPIEGAAVGLQPDAEKLSKDFSSFDMSFAMDQQETETDDAGQFRLGPFGDDVPADMILTFSHPRHITLRQPLETLEDLGDVVLQKRREVMVVVRNEGGDPIAGASVWTKPIIDMADMQDPAKGEEWGRSLGMGLVGLRDDEETNEAGEVFVYGEGRHQIHVAHEDYAPLADIPEVNFDDVGKGHVETVILNPGLALVLTVRHHDQTPAAGVAVEVEYKKPSANMLENMMVDMIGGFMPKFGGGSGLKTDDQGQVILEHLALGGYKIKLSREGLPDTEHVMEVTAGKETHELRLSVPSSLWGRVPASLAGQALMIQGGQTRKTLEIPEDGLWDSGPLAPGQYRVSFLNLEDPMALGLSMLGGAFANDDDAILLKAGQRLEVTLETPPTGRLLVTVFNHDGTPYKGMMMLLAEDMVVGDLNFKDRMFMAQTKGEGVYEFQRLPEGRWRLQAGAGQTKAAATREVRTRKDEEREIRWTLPRAESRLRGRVVKDDGSPATGLLQLFVPGKELPLGQTSLKADGSFELTGLIAQAYELKVGDGLSQGRSVGTVEVAGAETDAGLLKLAPGMALQGQIVARQGDLPFGLSVRLKRDGAVVAVGLPDLSGNFSFSNLDPVPGQIEALDSTGTVLATVQWDGVAESVDIMVDGED